MSDLAVTRAGGGHGRTALMLGVASLLLYIGGGFTVGGIFWVARTDRRARRDRSRSRCPTQGRRT